MVTIPAIFLKSPIHLRKLNDDGLLCVKSMMNEYYHLSRKITYGGMVLGKSFHYWSGAAYIAVVWLYGRVTPWLSLLALFAL